MAPRFGCQCLNVDTSRVTSEQILDRARDDASTHARTGEVLIPFVRIVTGDTDVFYSALQTSNDVRIATAFRTAWLENTREQRTTLRCSQTPHSLHQVSTHQRMPLPPKPTPARHQNHKSVPQQQMSSTLRKTPTGSEEERGYFRTLSQAPGVKAHEYALQCDRSQILTEL
jgi:hypothetical protein